jgi:hypothetical protein
MISLAKLLAPGNAFTPRVTKALGYFVDEIRVNCKDHQDNLVHLCSLCNLKITLVYEVQLFSIASDIILL